MKKFGFLVLCTMLIYTTSVEAVTTMTIATFDDPALSSTTHLFEVNLTNNLITGGWDDSQTNLDLDVVYSGNTFYDAFFVIIPVSYTGNIAGGITGSGTIKFFADNQSTSTTPLIQIDFDSANISLNSFGALELFSTNVVTIHGTEIGVPLTDEAFSFSFANQVALPIDHGYTATAAFTSSAVPEPATVFLLGIGGLITVSRRRPVVERLWNKSKLCFWRNKNSEVNIFRERSFAL